MNQKIKCFFGFHEKFEVLDDPLAKGNSWSEFWGVTKHQECKHCGWSDKPVSDVGFDGTAGY
jgi:hypothetical protein